MIDKYDLHCDWELKLSPIFSEDIPTKVTLEIVQNKYRVELHSIIDNFIQRANREINDAPNGTDNQQTEGGEKHKPCPCPCFSNAGSLCPLGLGEHLAGSEDFHCLVDKPCMVTASPVR